MFKNGFSSLDRNVILLTDCDNYCIFTLTSFRDE